MLSVADRYPICTECALPMMWCFAKSMDVAGTKRIVDKFQCRACGRSAWVDLEPRAFSEVESGARTRRAPLH